MKLEGLHILLIYQCTCECDHCFVWTVRGRLERSHIAALITEYNLPRASRYADACHLCYEAPTTLRERFPQYLNPDQMYGVMK